MIIGSGDIASVIPDREDVTFFASGVSNSGCTDEKEYEREKLLLWKISYHSHLVYFSSLSIYYSKGRYVDHKREMEWIIRERFNSYTIIRIGNISWGKNPHTLINYLKAHPEAPIQEVWRFIVDLDEFLYWLSVIPVGQRNEMNITGRMVWVPSLAKQLRNEVKGYIKVIPSDYFNSK